MTTSCVDRCRMFIRPGTNYILHMHPKVDNPDSIERVYLESEETGTLRAIPEVLWMSGLLLEQDSYDGAVAIIEQAQIR